MPHVRRTVGALSSLFLLQLSLLGSGTLCAMRYGASDAAGPGHSMHVMGDTVAGSTSAPEDAMSTIADVGGPVDPPDCHGPINQDGCQLPWAPGQCSSMTTCGITAAPTALIVTSWTAQAMSIEIAAPELVRSGPTFAPELPPPRA